MGRRASGPIGAILGLGRRLGSAPCCSDGCPGPAVGWAKIGAPDTSSAAVNAIVVVFMDSRGLGRLARYGIGDSTHTRTTTVHRMPALRRGLVNYAYPSLSSVAHAVERHVAVRKALNRFFHWQRRLHGALAVGHLAQQDLARRRPFSETISSDLLQKNFRVSMMRRRYARRAAKKMRRD